jgi:hypothetical protein
MEEGDKNCGYNKFIQQWVGTLLEEIGCLKLWYMRVGAYKNGKLTITNLLICG